MLIIFDFLHAQTFVRAIPRANAAVAAHDRRARVFVIADCLHHARALAFAAAYALMRIKQHAAAFPLEKRARRANFGAVRLSARMADRRDKSAG
jgi:hypothetical protein